MKAELKLVDGMKFVGTNENGKETFFDAYESSGGKAEHPSPMELTLQALAGCTAMDVVSIIRKKRKNIKSFKIFADAVQRDEHPRLFTKVHLMFELISEDAQIEDLDRAIEISQEKYCSVSLMLKAAGIEITWASVLKDE